MKTTNTTHLSAMPIVAATGHPVGRKHRKEVRSVGLGGLLFCGTVGFAALVAGCATVPGGSGAEKPGDGGPAAASAMRTAVMSADECLSWDTACLQGRRDGPAVISVSGDPDDSAPDPSGRGDEPDGDGDDPTGGGDDPTGGGDDPTGGGDDPTGGGDDPTGGGDDPTGGGDDPTGGGDDPPSGRGNNRGLGNGDENTSTVDNGSGNTDSDNPGQGGRGGGRGSQR